MNRPLFSFIIIVLSIGFGFMYVKPQYDRMQSQSDAIVRLDKTLAIAGEIEKKIENTKKELESISRADNERFAVFLPEKLDTIRFANNLQHIGKTHRLAISDIKIEDPLAPIATAMQTNTQVKKGALENMFSLERGVPRTEAGTSPTNPISSKKYRISKTSFSVSASYGDFFKLLADMENSLGLINITKLSFNPVSDTNSEVDRSAGQLYRYSVELETYSLN